MKLVSVVYMLHIYMCKLDHDGNVFFHCESWVKKKAYKLLVWMRAWLRKRHSSEAGVKCQFCGSQLSDLGQQVL